VSALQLRIELLKPAIVIDERLDLGQLLGMLAIRRGIGLDGRSFSLRQEPNRKPPPDRPSPKGRQPSDTAAQRLPFPRDGTACRAERNRFNEATGLSAVGTHSLGTGEDANISY